MVYNGFTSEFILQLINTQDNEMKMLSFQISEVNKQDNEY